VVNGLKLTGPVVGTVPRIVVVVDVAPVQRAFGVLAESDPDQRQCTERRRYRIVGCRVAGFRRDTGGIPCPAADQQRGQNREQDDEFSHVSASEQNRNSVAPATASQSWGQVSSIPFPQTSGT